MSADSLKPCPCGRSDEGAQAPIWNRGEWRIECACACGWAGPKADTPLEAANLWNKRESSPSADPVGEITGICKFPGVQHPTIRWRDSNLLEVGMHLYSAPTEPDLSQLQSELAAMDYQSEHSDEHRRGFELAKEAARALVASYLL